MELPMLHRELEYGRAVLSAFLQAGHLPGCSASRGRLSSDINTVKKLLVKLCKTSIEKP